MVARTLPAAHLQTSFLAPVEQQTALRHLQSQPQTYALLVLLLLSPVPALGTGIVLDSMGEPLFPVTLQNLPPAVTTHATQGRQSLLAQRIARRSTSSFRGITNKKSGEKKKTPPRSVFFQ